MAHNALREARVARYLTIRALAKLSGVSARTIARAEDGEPISDVNQQRLADALGFSSRRELFPEEAVA